MRLSQLIAVVLLAAACTETDPTADATQRDATFDTALRDAGGPDHRVNDVGEELDSAADVRDSGIQVDSATPLPCPLDMAHVGEFCMDRFEAPNLEGAAPLAMRNALDGEEWCLERGKRLCTEAEWVRACQGTAENDFPYGEAYERSTCNDDKTWISPNWGTLASWPSDAAMTEAERLYQADPSGSRTSCISEEGVFDLTANVAEWVRRSFPHANNYDHVMKGCYWAGCFGGTPPNCGFVNPAHPSGFRSYEAGFRCCSEIERD